MDWLAMSPDMNPIEHAWDQMSLWIRDMDRRPPSNLAELPQSIHKVWLFRLLERGTRAIINSITSVITWSIQAARGLVIWLLICFKQGFGHLAFNLFY